MIHRQMLLPLAALAALGLAGCNSGAAPADLAANAPNVAPGDVRLPEGAGCSGAVARYRAITDNDLAMGHVNRSVYDQIQGEISDAASACSAGRDARAVSLLHASRARHGYPG
ncbi:MAG: hypothetical protein HYS06_02425 [Methylocystis sp.]|nr:hypothetical protein [Methylocystis sp.]